MKFDQVIYKQEISINDRLELLLPKGVKILTVQTQMGKPCIWYMVDRKLAQGNDFELRVFRIYGTDHQIVSYDDREKFIYIGTFQELDGALVWHLFEEVKIDN